jgi:site-specific DNA-adenine methylase
MTQQQITRNESTNTATKITAIRTTVNPIISPFFQWVGGKRKFIDKLLERIPLDLNNYYEPFLGGGALFFQVKDKFNKCFLSDINLELTTSYNLSKRIQQKLLHYVNYIS